MSPFFIELEDRLRYSAAVRWSLCQFKLVTAPRPDPADPQTIARAVAHLCDAARLATNKPLLLEIEREIGRLVKLLDGRKIYWREFEPGAQNNRVEKAVVLKPFVSEREKGAVYISFEYQWVRLVANCDVGEFTKRYTLILSPVWATPHALVNYVLPAVANGPVISHLSDPNDAEVIPRQSSNYVTVPLLCSSWVNPAFYKPVPFEKKDIDIVMLANFGKYKRHFTLFKALRDMPKSLKVVLIGQHNGKRTRDVLLAEAAAYGVVDRIELRQNVSDAELFDTLARAKISLILSLREGSCVAIVESMFAGTPVGMFADAEVGSRQFINSQTGRFLLHKDLASQLMDFIASSRNFSPRKWVEENQIHCHGSSAKLNAAVKQAMLAAGQQWTVDLAPFHWRPDPLLLSEADKQRMKPSYDDIRKRFGIEIGTPDLYA